MNLERRNTNHFVVFPNNKRYLGFAMFKNNLSNSFAHSQFGFFTDIKPFFSGTFHFTVPPMRENTGSGYLFRQRFFGPKTAGNGLIDNILRHFMSETFVFAVEIFAIRTAHIAFTCKHSENHADKPH